MAERICESFQTVARRLMELGLGYLTLDRAAATLSTGERQRMQLARAVRNRTTGVLYVLDEPSIGLHPANIAGLTAVMDDLVADGNSVLLVDHDAQILSHADWIIEMGPEAGGPGRPGDRPGLRGGTGRQWKLPNRGRSCRDRCNPSPGRRSDRRRYLQRGPSTWRPARSIR